MARSAEATARRSSRGEITPRIGIVCFAIGFAQAGGPAPVPGPVLLAAARGPGRVRRRGAGRCCCACAARGYSARSGRGARRATSSRRAVSAAQARAYRQLNGERPAWSGAFSGLLFTVPEAQRAFRDKLRRQARLLGYGLLQPGLLIAATDRYEELAGLLLAARQPVRQASLAFSAADSRAIAADLLGPARPRRPLPAR